MADWAASAYFDVVAKVPDGATRDQVRAMLQNLLQERFQLAVKQQTRDMPVYALVVPRGGSKLVEAKPEDAAHAAAGFRSPPTSWHLQNGAAPISALVAFLSLAADRPVIDETGLTGRYKMDLEFERSDLTLDAPQGPPLPTLPLALEEQLGLKLESRKAPVRVVLVTRLEKIPLRN